MVACEAQSFSTHTRIGRKRSRLTAKLGLVILLTPSYYFSHAFQPNHRPFQRTSNCLQLEASLNELTVKELRELVKQSSAERGVLSSLKKKQDLIDYLEENQESDRPVFSISNNTLLQEVTNPQKEEIQSVDPPQQAITEQPPPVKSSGSPKDAIFEKVYERYPPIRDAPEMTATPPAEDIRQLYHPIFQNSIPSSDMDVVFVGTASCTPGVTRGVSCTALRLNWRPRGAFGASGGADGEQPSTFLGGTWLFDVGECTQVCCLFQSLFSFRNCK